MAQMSLHLCADSPEPSLLVSAIGGNLVHLPRYDWLVNVVKHVTKRLSASIMEAQRGHTHDLSNTATPPHRDYVHYNGINCYDIDSLGHYCLSHAAGPKNLITLFWHNMILICSNKFGQIATSSVVRKAFPKYQLFCAFKGKQFCKIELTWYCC